MKKDREYFEKIDDKIADKLFDNLIEKDAPLLKALANTPDNQEIEEERE